MNVLFLCTHNSARSVLAEAMCNQLAQQLGRNIKAFSAGSTPKGHINPYALQVLAQKHIDTHAYYSKSWDVFTQTEHPPMDAVITVCSAAANESCPLFLGSPVQAHWGYPDPSNTQGDEATMLEAFEVTRQAIAYKLLQLFLHYPSLETLSPSALQHALLDVANNT